MIRVTGKSRTSHDRNVLQTIGMGMEKSQILLQGVSVTYALLRFCRNHTRIRPSHDNLQLSRMACERRNEDRECPRVYGSSSASAS